MNLMKFFLASVVCLFQIGLSAFAQTSCGALSWALPPTVVNRHFEGTLVQKCEMTAQRAGDIKAVHQYFVDDTLAMAETIHQGPITKSFQSMPAIYFELTGRILSDLRARGERLLATDDTDHFYDRFRSKEVFGTGDKALVRNLDFDLHLARMNETQFTVEFANRLRVQKPFLVPTGIFISEVKQSAESDFPKKRDRILQDIEDHL